MKKINFLYVLLISLLLLCSNATVKADTIHVQLPVPGNVLAFCYPSGFDTFIFHQPGGYFGSMWYVNGSYQTTADSLIFTPSSFGTITIDATYGILNVGVALKLYGGPPSHADITTNGIMNLAKDTAWMCGSSINLGATINGSEVLSLYWGSVTGYHNNTNFVTITTPDTYFFYQDNTCGSTIDTVQVIAEPSSLPIWSDTTFCNTPISLTLDPGLGWNYLWNTGATTQTLFVDTAGTYTVNLSNHCTSGSVSMTVSHQSYPLPDLSSNINGLPHCAMDVIVLDPAPGYAYDSYTWSTGATTPTLTVSSPNGDYYVTVTQGGCSESAYTPVSFYSYPASSEICVVTVDISLNKNKIVWTADYEPIFGDFAYAKIASYNVYKAVGFNSWSLIGNVPADQEHTFIDMASSPSTVSSLYKISMVDTCGMEGLKSFYHKTILLAVTQGANPGEIPLIWNAYQDESGVFQVDKYYIYRGDSPGTLSLLDSVPGYNNNYIDTGIYTQKYYQIGVVKVGGCNSSPTPFKSKSITSGSFSNIANNTISGISDFASINNISVYPNPSTGIFQVRGKSISLVEVLDETGRVLLQTKNTTVDVTQFVAGIYHVRITSGAGSTSHRTIVVQ